LEGTGVPEWYKKVGGYVNVGAIVWPFVQLMAQCLEDFTNVMISILWASNLLALLVWGVGAVAVNDSDVEARVERILRSTPLIGMSLNLPIIKFSNNR
jgi:hypothetical protein